jgi:hypothetical protein
LAARNTKLAITKASRTTTAMVLAFTGYLPTILPAI